MLVIDKPAGMPVHRGPKGGPKDKSPGQKAMDSLREVINKKFPDARYGAVTPAAYKLINGQCAACRAPPTGPGPARMCSMKCNKTAPHDSLVAAAKALTSIK